MNRDELGIAVETLDFISVSDDVMDVYVTCGITEEKKSINVDFTATARISEDEEIMRLNSSFVLQDMSTTTSSTYLCNDENQNELFSGLKKQM